MSIRSEDHHLPDTCVDGGTEVLAEEAGAHPVVAGNLMHASAELSPSSQATGVWSLPRQYPPTTPTPGELSHGSWIGRGRFHGTPRPPTRWR